MADWSEAPDGRKPPLGHGNEKARAVVSFEAAVKHYVNYLKDKSNKDELRTAAECLGHAYHYIEDVGDFSQSWLLGPDNTPLRNAVTEQLKLMYLDPGAYRKEIEDKKKIIPADIQGVLDFLGRREQREKVSPDNVVAIRDRILWIVARS